jgi:hypothetical protein
MLLTREKKMQQHDLARRQQQGPARAGQGDLYSAAPTANTAS